MRKKIIIALSALAVITLAGCAAKTDNTVEKKAKSAENKTKIELPADEYDGMDKTAYRPQYYKKYFEETYDEERIDDISQWKDADGNWCYPKDYELVCMPSRDEVMARQQFPEELLKDLDTEELYQFVLNAPGWMCILAYDDYLVALSTYRSIYNFMDTLMKREDLADVVHKQYETYSENDIFLLSKENRHVSDDTKKQDQFQLTEALELFYAGKLPEDAERNLP